MVKERTVTVLLFEGFEVLDVFGPVELFANVPGWTVEFAGPVAGRPVSSAQGVEVVAQLSYDDLTGPDVLLLPGGKGTRALIHDAAFLTMLSDLAGRAKTVVSVCTGSALLAAAGALAGRRATSNKLSWDWVTTQADGTYDTDIEWVPKARWIVDGRYWTSSGVAAGMDMAHALISSAEGSTVADQAADAIELEVHRDPTWDPFAEVHGVVSDGR